MRKWLICGLVVVCLGLAALPGQATERGLASYPDGAENFFAGALPPPGTYFQYYFLFYNAPRVREAVPPETHGELVANVFRLIYISKVNILGATWGAHIILPIVYAGLHFQPAPMSDYQFGFGNISINPLLLGWHFGDYHATFGFDIDFPGTYNRRNLASPSQNYFTFRPVVGLAWLPKCGFGANIKMMYDFPTRNQNPILAQNFYQSGQAFHFDYCVDYALLPNLRLGVAGFYYVQTTADNADGRNIGNHGRQLAIGPAIKYDYQRWSFLVSPQFEMATINRPEGQRYWARVWYAF